MNFSSMKVGSRLALGFSTLIVIGIVVAVFGRIQLERLADEVQLLVDDRMVKVEQITEAINNINLIARSVRNIALTSDHQEMEEEKKRIDEARVRTAEIYAQLEKSIHTPEGRDLLQKVIAASVPYYTATDKAVSLGLANQAASNWMASSADVESFLPEVEGERVACLPFQYSGGIQNQELIQTFCPKMWPMMEAVASPRDWRDPDVLVALGRATVTSTEAMALPHLESVAP